MDGKRHNKPLKPRCIDVFVDLPSMVGHLFLAYACGSWCVNVTLRGASYVAVLVDCRPALV